VQKPTILFVEDNVPFLKTRKWRLEAEGYEVLCASTVQRARNIIKDRWVHLVIIDVRLMGKSGNVTDVSGLALAREIDWIIPTIIITAFATPEIIRSVVRIIGDERASAVDFLAKQDGENAMLEAVRRVLKEHVRINRNLDLKLCRPDSFLLLVGVMEKPHAAGRLLTSRADEMEDIFRKLFAEHTQVTLNRFTPHSEGMNTVLVTAVSNRGTDHFAVKCGCRRDVLANMQQIHQRHIYFAETLHYAAVAYPVNSWQRIVEMLPQLGLVAEFLGSVVSLLVKAFDA